MCASPAWMWQSESEADTLALGRALGELLAPGDLLLLEAPFGAGKTHLCKGIAAAWGVAPDDVLSPSFVLVNQYIADAAHGRIPLYHADLYRIETAHDLATVGLEETLGDDGIALIEWAERAGDWLPANHLLIRIAIPGEGTRVFAFEPHGARYATLIEQLKAAPVST